MNAKPPRIAIPEPTSTDPDYNDRSLPQYVQAIEAAGGVGIPIPLLATSEVQAALVASCSGVLLPGSPADVDPERYGQRRVEACAAKDAARESTDDLLLNDVFRQGKPMLGICFGLQSLNVWQKGTLLQDLPKADGAHPCAVNHQPGRDVMEAHKVVVTPGSQLSQILPEGSYVSKGRLNLQVNSSHHQAVDRPGEMLRVAARSAEDDVIEALESADPRKFVVAVQWHPERSYEQSAASRAIFASFLQAAANWQSSKWP